MNYFCGYQISNLQKDASRKIVMVLGVCFNIGLLSYFKYVDFFIENANFILSNNYTLLNIVLPLGISFFTFQQIAFLVDTYQNKAQEYNFIHYCLFVTFFPQLIAGPIVHHKEVLPQFEKSENFLFNLENFQKGTTIFVIGLFKKIILADNIAEFASPTFQKAMTESILFFEAWGGALAYTFQLYFDFSGYADMAIGAALMMNIRLPINFNSPYKATNISEFWRRWHITLSTFLRDYLYIPLGGNRKGAIRRYKNLLITMLLGGIWHGAGWTFFIWGGLHGLYLIINHFWIHICEINYVLSSIRKNYYWQLISWLITFVAVVVAWVLFRAETFDAALNILNGMMGQNGAVFSQSIAGKVPLLKDVFTTFNVEFVDGIGKDFVKNYLWIAVSAVIALLFPNSIEIAKYALSPKNRNLIKISWAPNYSWAVIVGIIFSVSVLGLSKVGEFIYFQF